MPYTITPTTLPDVLILEPKVFGDARGFFFESFNQRDFAEVSLLWNDPAVGVQWPLDGQPQLAAKDMASKRLAEAEVFG